MDFLPPGEGMAGVCFLPTDFLAELLPLEGVLLSDDLLGVYLRIFSTLLPTSPARSLLPFLALEAALALPLAPPLTFGAGPWVSVSDSRRRASFPFS